MHNKETDTPQDLRAPGAGGGAAGAGRVLPAQRPGDGLRQFGAQQHRPAGGEPPGRLQPEARGGAVAQAAANEQERYDKTFKGEEKRVPGNEVTQPITALAARQGDRGGLQVGGGRTTWLMGESKNRRSQGLGSGPRRGRRPGTGQRSLRSAGRSSSWGYVSAGLAVLALLGAWSLGAVGCTAPGSGYGRMGVDPRLFFCQHASISRGNLPVGADCALLPVDGAARVGPQGIGASPPTKSRQSPDRQCPGPAL